MLNMCDAETKCLELKIKTAKFHALRIRTNYAKDCHNISLDNFLITFDDSFILYSGTDSTPRRRQCFRAL